MWKEAQPSTSPSTTLRPAILQFSAPVSRGIPRSVPLKSLQERRPRPKAQHHECLAFYPERSQVLNLLVELKRDLRLTYVFVSHNLAAVSYVSDRIAVMYLGKLV